MELMVIFAIGWVASHAFSEKRDEYSASQEAHREKYLRKLDKQHPSWGRARREQYLRNAARRNALGHFAYLLRHGWSSTFNDFHHGWKQAKEAHEEWKTERSESEKKPGNWATFKAGWKERWAQRPQVTGYYTKPEPSLTPEPDPTPPPAATAPTSDSPVPAPASPAAKPAESSKPDAQIIQMSGKKTSGDTAGSTNRSTTVEFNYDRTRAEMNRISEFVTSKLSVLEQIIADAIAGDLNQDTETMAHLASLQEALSNSRVQATAVAASMTKHTSGQEYANTGHAASTSYLKSN